MLLSGAILFVWKYGIVPYDLNIFLFLLFVTCIFLVGQILEWKYHISYPFSEAQDNYHIKKKLVYGVIGALAAGILITVLVFMFDNKFIKIFLAFLVILLLSLITLFILAIIDGIKKISNCCKTKEKF